MKIDWRPSGKTNKSTWSQIQKKLLNTDQKSIASLFPKDYINGEASYDLKKKLWKRRENYNKHLSLDDTIELQIRWKYDIYIFKESTKPKESVRKKGYGFLSFAKNMIKNIGKNKKKNLIDRYSLKLLGHVKQSAEKPFKKQQKQMVIWLGIRLLIKLKGNFKKFAAKLFRDSYQ